ncbi:malto-oligosyltrehalose synthase [Gordonia sp. HNM0687]|uniref:Malto-oligosyltrehalose synthase n=1 Tax=Gordonia mangrovi TaxID=2665643 RepID=A0A6L7GMM0_9ACTN|nr:malto-oligosyltrehalose synthase [Gordonia mangrovi]MXP21160.1 malto-oligosyltrehalose synthase [Gordonia mangrovi]UVF78305.1 malto-oligosyltrehalose synthase [Gordonia mangrovi]
MTTPSPLGVGGLREPVATYRVQLTPDFGFAEVIGILDHLVSLGVSHLYLSPIGRATAGSTHGYDWVPPPVVAPELGGLDGLRELRSAARAVGLGLIVDIVPNHTGVADVTQNPWFGDLLRYGSASRYASWFDVDFSSDNGADGKIALPVLAADGDLSPLAVTDGHLRYYDHVFPVTPGSATSGDPIAVHERQHYRLVPWDSGLIGYRRFFTVNELAGLRQEEPAVYSATHGWLLDLVDEDLIDGVRVDHPDGLWDPQSYLRRLRSDLGERRLLYIEKILAADEPLEPTLPVDGTTGYDQLRIIDGVFTAPSGIVELGEIHERLTGQPGDGDWLHHAERTRKLTTLREMFPTEHRRLVRAITHSDPSADAAAVAEATAELIADLGVYRADYPSLRARLERVASAIAVRIPRLAPALDLVIRTTASPGAATSRLAQTCGAVTAKSVEDSLFYRTARLVSAQEVGGDPADPTVSVREFHAHNLHRNREWPWAMTATSTHDTKRGEDVRARIAVLSQVPERWSMVVDTLWRSTPPPDDLTGYFLLQNIIGVWPVDGSVDDTLRTRITEYATKAARESGLRTTWTEVDDDFESALAAWIAAITTGEAAQKISALVAEIAASWRTEALGRKLIALLGPGVGDIYQGTQWWDDSLVDPDNRRPVDHDRPTEHPKAQLIRAALGVRTRHAAAFGAGSDYTPLHADGRGADHVIAFARGAGGRAEVVVVATRLTHSLSEAGGKTTNLTLPAGRWLDALAPDHEIAGAEPVALSEITAFHGVGLLARAD